MERKHGGYDRKRWEKKLLAVLLSALLTATSASTVFAETLMAENAVSEDAALPETAAENDAPFGNTAAEVGTTEIADAEEETMKNADAEVGTTENADAEEEAMENADTEEGTMENRDTEEETIENADAEEETTENAEEETVENLDPEESEEEAMKPTVDAAGSGDESPIDAELAFGENDEELLEEDQSPAPAASAQVIIGSNGMPTLNIILAAATLDQIKSGSKDTKIPGQYCQYDNLRFCFHPDKC